MVKHKAVLDYANFTASVQRHGKRYTLSPQSILTDVADYDSKATDKHVRNLIQGHLLQLRRELVSV